MLVQIEINLGTIVSFELGNQKKNSHDNALG